MRAVHHLSKESWPRLEGVVFLTFDLCTLEERAEFRLVFSFCGFFSSHRRSSTGEVSLLARSHVACVLNYRKIKELKNRVEK